MEKKETDISKELQSFFVPKIHQTPINTYSFETLKETLREICDERDNLKKQLLDQQDFLKQNVQKEIKEIQQKLNNEKSSNQTLKTINQELQASLDRLKKKEEELEIENKVLIEHSKEEIRKLKDAFKITSPKKQDMNEVKELKIQNGLLKKRLEQKEESINFLNSELSKLVAPDDTIVKYKSYKKKYKKSKQKLNEKIKELDKEKNQLEKMKKDLIKMCKENEEQRKQLENISGLEESLTKKNTYNKEGINVDYKNKLEELRRKYNLREEDKNNNYKYSENVIRNEPFKKYDNEFERKYFNKPIEKEYYNKPIEKDYYSKSLDKGYLDGFEDNKYKRTNEDLIINNNYKRKYSQPNEEDFYSFDKNEEEFNKYKFYTPSNKPKRSTDMSFITKLNKFNSHEDMVNKSSKKDNLTFKKDLEEKNERMKEIEKKLEEIKEFNDKLKKEKKNKKDDSVKFLSLEEEEFKSIENDLNKSIDENESVKLIEEKNYKSFIDNKTYENDEIKSVATTSSFREMLKRTDNIKDKFNELENELEKIRNNRSKSMLEDEDSNFL